MSTANKLNKLLETKQAIKQAIVDKGIEVGDDTKFSDYPAKIESIVSEGADPIYETYWNAITNNNTDYQYLFSYYSGKELDVSKLDTSNVTDMSYIFYDCSDLTSLDVSNFNTSKVTDMRSMFYNCNNLTSLDVSNFNTSNVTNMNYMFAFCYKLTSLDASNFDTGNVDNISYMFYNCQSLTTLDVSNFDISNVTNMAAMFQYCNALTSLDLSSWDVGHITGYYYFYTIIDSCPALVDFKAPKNISTQIDVSKTTALSHDSLMSIINNLITRTSTETLKLGSTNLAKLTAEELAIATNKGWTIE